MLYLRNSRDIDRARSRIRGIQSFKFHRIVTHWDMREASIHPPPHGADLADTAISTALGSRGEDVSPVVSRGEGVRTRRKQTEA